METIFAFIFILGVIAAGIWLLRACRYHIFYFSLCGLFLFSFVMFLNGVSALSDRMVSSEYMGDGVAYEEPGPFDGIEFFLFFRATTFLLFFLLAILSLINPFFRENKLAVKIVSGAMILLCVVITVIAYGISHMGKIGG